MKHMTKIRRGSPLIARVGDNKAPQGPCATMQERSRAHAASCTQTALSVGADL